MRTPMPLPLVVAGLVAAFGCDSGAAIGSVSTSTGDASGAGAGTATPGGAPSTGGNGGGTAPGALAAAGASQGAAGAGGVAGGAGTSSVVATAEAGSPSGGGGSGSGGGDATAGADAMGGAGGSSSAGTSPCLDFGEPELVGELVVSLGPSGMAASRANPGVLYVHADAGEEVAFYAADVSGQNLARVVLTGATHDDWEDAAVGPGPDGEHTMYVGDIGDNAARTASGSPRDEITVYRFLEPTLSLDLREAEREVDDWEALVFTYPDGPRDAEALMVDPTTGDILLVTKHDDGAFEVYRASGDTPADVATELVLVTALAASETTGAPVSAGDIAPTGDRVVLRTLSEILVWPHVAGASFAETFAAAPLLPSAPDEPQPEAIAFAHDGTAFFSAGEQVRSVYRASAVCP